MKRGTKRGREESKKPNPVPRNPLTNLNTVSRSTSSNSSSSLSVEASSRGCLSFFLPSSNSRTTDNAQKIKTLLPKTPKSAPISRPSKPRSKLPTPKIPEKPLLQKSMSSSTPSLKKLRNGKNPSFSATPSHPKPSTVLKEGPCQKQQQEQWQMSREMRIDTGEPPDNSIFSFGNKNLDDSRNVTPLSKLVCGSGLDAMEENSTDDTTTTTTTTPPVQASISPEIQCGSSISSMTPTCFGAGHVLSGVSDKRKCRPRGILTVEKELGFCKARVSDADSDDDESFFLKNSRVSLIPAPSEASMHWILSPCKEEDDQKGIPQDGSTESRRLKGPTPFHSLSSPSSADGFPSDACGNGNSRNTGSSIKRACLICPGLPVSLSPSLSQMSPSDHLVYCSSPSFSATATTSCKFVFSKEDRGYRYELATENSPLSAESLDSQNVIQTPQSDSSTDKPIGCSWLKNAVDHQDKQFELNSMRELLQKKSLSPDDQTSRLDPAYVLPMSDFSFQLANSALRSNFIDQVDLQKSSNSQFWQFSDSSFGNVSQSQTRMSWREGLASQNVDELDCCRLLSDEEEDVNCRVDEQSNSDVGCKLDKNIENDPTLISTSKSPAYVFKEPETGVRSKGKSKRDSPCQIPNSCAESISTEGGGLIASGDSDWTLCYKNQLFPE